MENNNRFVSISYSLYIDEDGEYWAGSCCVLPEWCVDEKDYKEYIRNEESKNEKNI